jgi:hypothetical protein
MDEKRGITVQDIKLLLNCPTIDAAEARRDRFVDMVLLVPHPKLKDGKQNVYFLSNYVHVVNERLKRRSKEALHHPKTSLLP